ncbi:type I polyketide synthase [Burkholderia gladioli]|uniref:type I polyketide synthase n=1 Tax=Burkholderia gladioli TaxID=28095 RepID=UPI0016408473|nr:type I polyketide synthase [Burkholderia gladioli]
MHTQADSRIAIIGTAYRFPGEVRSSSSYWSLLQSGRSVLRDTPAERFDIDACFDPDHDTPGTTYARRAGYVDGVFEFDPAFFRISHAEALAMDPQQRWMLELCWHALENAGIVPSQLRGQDVGVFLGSGEVDYGRRSVWSGDPRRITSYARLGTNKAVLAGRIAYCFGVHGPAVFVDTACSSSLAAVHLAAQSLLAGDCDIAIAGGINLILGPEETIAMARLQAMSRSEHCRPFDARADGYMRGEGGGVVVLKRLAEACESGDRIDAVLAGSAINSDGASNGLTAPNGAAQERVIRRALARAGIGAESVAYVEAHGTGTPLGDPIELGALRNVYARDVERARPLMVGSVKAQLGHLESAAGIAGLIKAMLVLRHGRIPPQAGFAEPNPRFRWQGSGLRVSNESAALDPGAHVGVSSFGISGTNVHLVLAGAPAHDPAVLPARERVLPLSAHTPAGCSRLAAAFRHHLAHENVGLRELCYTASLRREHWPVRVALVGTTRRDFIAALDDFLAGEPSGRWHLAEADPKRKLVFLIPGQGAWQPGVGAELYRDNPLFHRNVDRCLKRLEPQLAAEVLAALRGDQPDVVRHRIGQLAHFVFHLALANVWIELGREPDVVIGHSLGEHVAAVIAGVMSVEDGLKAVEARGRLFDSETPRGAMLAVAADVDELHEWFEIGRSLFIAGINGPGQTVLSGTAAAVCAAQERVVGKGRRVSLLKTYDTPGHSPLLATMRASFASALAPLDFKPPRIRLISTLTGRTTSPDIARVEHWLDLVEQPVRFAEALGELSGEDCVYLEVGPGSALSNLVRAATQRWDLSISSLADGPEGDEHAEPTGFAHACARLYGTGHLDNWAALYRQPPQPAELPTYPFERIHLELPVPEAQGRTPGEPLAPDAFPDVGRQVGADAEQGVERGAPGSDVLALIRDIVASMQVRPEGIDDNAALTRCGFDSLSLTELRNRLRLALGRSVPVSLLARGASIASLAAFFGDPSAREVRQARPTGSTGSTAAPRQAATSLVETLREGEGAVIALIHPVGGDVLCYQALADSWPGDPKVVGIRHPDLEVPTPFAARTMPELARQYRDALESALGRLPDHLGGWSFGGLVAHEMAAQWEAQGREAPPLLIIDSPFPGGSFMARLQSILAEARERTLDALLASAGFIALLDQDLGLAAMRSRMAPDAFERLLSIVASNALALGLHVPGCIDAPILYALALKGVNSQERRAPTPYLHAMTRAAVGIGVFDDDHDSIVGEFSAGRVAAFFGESHAGSHETLAGV